MIDRLGIETFDVSSRADGEAWITKRRRKLVTGGIATISPSFESCWTSALSMVDVRVVSW